MMKVASGNSSPMVAWSIFQGIVALVMLATVFFVEIWAELPEAELRALIFFALVSEILALILVNRSFSASLGDALVRQNAALRYVVVAVLAITGVILFWPYAQVLLKFGSIAWNDMVLASGLGVILLVVLEGCKHWVPRSTVQTKERAAAETTMAA